MVEVAVDAVTWHVMQELPHKLYARPTIAGAIDYFWVKYKIWIWVEKHESTFRAYASEEEDSYDFGLWEGNKMSKPWEAYQEMILNVSTKIYLQTKTTQKS